MKRLAPESTSKLDANSSCCLSTLHQPFPLPHNRVFIKGFFDTGLVGGVGWAALPIPGEDVADAGGEL